MCLGIKTSLYMCAWICVCCENCLKAKGRARTCKHICMWCSDFCFVCGRFSVAYTHNWRKCTKLHARTHIYPPNIQLVAISCQYPASGLHVLPTCPASVIYQQSTLAAQNNYMLLKCAYQNSLSLNVFLNATHISTYMH